MHSDILTKNRLIIPLMNIILRTNMHEPHNNTRHRRHDIIRMRDTIITPLRRDEIAKFRPRDPRRAIRVQIDLVPVNDAQLGRRERRDGAAQRVARHDELVRRVRGRERLDGIQDRGARVEPALPEAAVRGAAGAQVCVYFSELEVREPVCEGVGAAEGDDDELVCGVQGYEAGYVGCERAVVFDG